MQGVLTRLYFGTDIFNSAYGEPNNVTEEDFNSFLAKFFDPNLPGYNVQYLTGRYLMNDGTLVKENTYMVEFVLSSILDDDMLDKICTLIDDATKHYKEKFQQESVLVVSTPVAFDFM